MVGEFEERAEKLGHSSLVKEAARYAEEMGLQLELEYPNPTCTKHDSKAMKTAEKLKAELRRGLEQKTWQVVHQQSWQGKLTCMRRDDMSLNFDGCFWWLSSWKQCRTHTVWVPWAVTTLRGCMPARKHTRTRKARWCAGYVIKRLKVSPMSWVVVRPLHRTSTLPDTMQPWRSFSQDFVVFLGLVDSVPPCYPPLKPKPVYESKKAFWDVPLIAEHLEVRANRVEACIINHCQSESSRWRWVPHGSQDRRKKKRRKLQNTDHFAGN